MAGPLLRSYVRDSHRPATVPGGWVGEPAWPSPHVRGMTYACQGAPVLVRSPIHTGLDADRFFPFANDADLPPDQREEDACARRTSTSKWARRPGCWGGRGCGYG